MYGLIRQAPQSDTEKGGYVVIIKFYFQVLKNLLNLPNFTKMVQSRPTFDVIATFLSNFIKAFCGAPGVRSDSLAVRFWNAASQPALPVRLLSTNWSRCF